MKLYLISQDENRGYEACDSAVVRAPDELTARSISPYSGDLMTNEDWKETHSLWCSSIVHVKAEYLGEAEESAEQGLVLSSFNAG